jgi:hypothetical protein
MQMIVLTGLPTKAKELLTRDLAAHFIQAGQRVAVLDNAGVGEGLTGLDVQVLSMRGGCACCSVAGKLYACAESLPQQADIAIMAADSQTHVSNLVEVLDNFAAGSSADIEVHIAALVDDRTSCCFPYLAETLETAANVTLQAPFSAADVLAGLNG